MGILKINSQAKSRFIGHAVSDEVYEFFSLYAVAYKVSKSAMYMDLVNSWMKEIRGKKTDEALMARIILDLRKEFKKINEDKDWFKRKCKKELLRKGINKHNVDLIIRKI